MQVHCEDDSFGPQDGAARRDLADMLGEGGAGRKSFSEAVLKPLPTSPFKSLRHFIMDFPSSADMIAAHLGALSTAL